MVSSHGAGPADGNLTRHVDDMHQRVMRLATRIEAMELQLAQKDTFMEDMQRQIAQKDKCIEDMHQQINCMRQDIRMLQDSRLVEMQQEITRMAAQQDSRMEAMHLHLTRLATQQDTMAAQRDALAQAVHTMGQQVLQLHGTVGSWTTATSSWQDWQADGRQEAGRASGSDQRSTWEASSW